MQVKTIRGRRGDVICKFNGLTGLFDRQGEQPEPNQIIEVMLCQPIWPKTVTDDIRTFIVQPVTTDHVLVKHFGFKCEQGRKFMSAPLHVQSMKDLEEACQGAWKPEFVTPGRTPVNEGHIHGREGEAYVLINDIHREFPRICGVPNLDCISHEVKERFPLTIC